MRGYFGVGVEGISKVMNVGSIFGDPRFRTRAGEYLTAVPDAVHPREDDD